MPKAKTKPKLEELDYNEILTMGLYMHCHVCAVAESCMSYDHKEPKRQCPIEPIIYRKAYEDLIQRKNVEPEKYMQQIHELAMLRVKKWRRERFEDMLGTTEADLQGSSQTALQIERIILKKEKQLGTDRETSLNLKKIGAKKGDMTSAFGQIEKIAQGKIQITNPKEILDESKRLVRGAIISIEHKKLTVADLQFDKLGVEMEVNPIEVEPEKIEDIPYKRPKRKSK